MEEDAGPLQRGEEEPLFLESELEEGAKARMETVGYGTDGGPAGAGISDARPGAY